MLWRVTRAKYTEMSSLLCTDLNVLSGCVCVWAGGGSSPHFLSDSPLRWLGLSPLRGCVQERTVDLRLYSSEYKASRFENLRGLLLYLVRVKIKMTSNCIFIFLKEGALGQM